MIVNKRKGFTPLEVRSKDGQGNLPGLLLTGFTLIELLVVIAIIALLMSILMPALSSTKDQVKAVICLSNLHEWGLVMKMYTDENEGLFMPDLGHGSYAAMSRPELKVYYKDDKLLLCPMATKTYEAGARNPFGAWRGDEEDDPLGNLPCSYGINTWILSNATANYQTDEKMWKTPNVKGAGYVPMVVDCAGYQNASPWHRDEPPTFDGEFIQDTSFNEMRYVCLNRHNEHINGVFMDFSTRKIGLKELWELHWHRNWNPGHDPPPAWPAWMAHMRDYW